jgi:tetratricopeptide (TPR) repeat protein
MPVPPINRPSTTGVRLSSSALLPSGQSLARLAAGGLAGLALGLAACKNFTPEWQREGNATPEGMGTVGGAGQSNVEAGEAALDAGDHALALEEFNKALEVNPTLTDAHMGIGDIHRAEGDFTKAEQAYAKAAALAPKNFDAQYFHGLSLHMLNRVTDAVGAYLRALSVEPENFRTNLYLSVAYYQLGESNHAYTFGERAVKLNPKSGEARAQLAAIYADLGRYEESVTEFQQSFELVQPTARILIDYAESLRNLGRFGEMRSTLEQLIKSEPSAAAWERLGYAQFKLKEFDRAQASYEASLKIDADYFPALNGVGVCELNRYAWSNNTDNDAKIRGLNALKRSLTVNRNQPSIEALIGRFR